MKLVGRISTVSIGIVDHSPTNSDTSSKLSRGTIVGIAIGGFIIIFVLIVTVTYCLCLKSSKRTDCDRINIVNTYQPASTLTDGQDAVNPLPQLKLTLDREPDANPR